MTDLPKRKQIVKSAGSTRRRVLTVVRELLERRMTRSEFAKRLKLSERTIGRIYSEAAIVGFRSVSRGDKIGLSLQRKRSKR